MLKYLYIEIIQYIVINLSVYIKMLSLSGVFWGSLCFTEILFFSHSGHVVAGIIEPWAKMNRIQ